MIHRPPRDRYKRALYYERKRARRVNTRPAVGIAEWVARVLFLIMLLMFFAALITTALTFGR